MKALDKDPSRRYRSADMLGEEIRRHIEGLRVEARQQALPDAARRFLVRDSWWLTLTAVLVWALYSGFIRLPNSVLVGIGVTAAVFGGGYYLGTYERGAEHARQELWRFAKLVPFIVIVLAIEQRLLPSVPISAIPGFLFVMMISCWLYCIIQTIRWRRRERLGPVVLELDFKMEKMAARFCVALVLAALLFETGEAWQKAEPNQLFPVAMILGICGPLLALWFIARPQIRQKGVIQHMGTSFAWTNVKAYSWEQGGGKLEGKYDVLNLSFRGVNRQEFHIPIGDRPAIQALLEEQLQEWPT